MTTDEIANLQVEIETWVAVRLAQGLTLFSDELAPPCGTPYALLSAAMERNQTHFNVPEIIEPLRAASDHVVRRRRILLGLSRAARVHEPRGKWLLYSPDWADFCQLAHEPGFVDESDAPAWDLWACWTRTNILVSWVPNNLVDRYDDATQLSPCSTIIWDNDKARGRPGLAMSLLRSA